MLYVQRIWYGFFYYWWKTSMKTKKEIFRDILISAETNCVLKIKVKGIANPLITAVDTVAKNRIMLKPTCLYGYTLMKRKLTLLEIESVTRYKTHFDHPIFQKIRFIRNNVSSLRRNLERVNGEIAGFNPSTSS